MPRKASSTTSAPSPALGGLAALLKAMGLAAVQVTPEVVALRTSVPKRP